MIARIYGRWMPSADDCAGQRGEALWAVTDLKVSDLKKLKAELPITFSA